jgi:predicted DNA binding protein
MRYLTARLEQPEWMRHPMQEFLASSAAVQREELLGWNLSRDDVQLLLFYVEGDVDAYRDRIETIDAIRRFELTPVDDASFYVYVSQAHTDFEAPFFGAFADLHLVVVPPVRYGPDGDPEMTVVGTEESLRALVEALREQADVSVDVRTVGTYDRRHGTLAGELTDRQFAAVEAATELGYYAAPRAASLAAVADELDVAKGTASELLRRAESRLMTALVGSSE